MSNIAVAKIVDVRDSISLHRFQKLALLAVASLGVMLISSLVTGWLLYSELTTTYSENYTLLHEAGFSDLVTAPAVVEDRLVLMLGIMPLIGAGLVLPLFLLAMHEIERLKLSYHFIDKDVAGHVEVADAGIDQAIAESGAVIDDSILLTDHCQVLVEHTASGSELVLVRIPA